MITVSFPGCIPSLNGPIHHWHHEVTWNVEPKSQEGSFLSGMMLTLTSYKKTPPLVMRLCQLSALPLDIDVAATLEFSIVMGQLVTTIAKSDEVCL